MTPWPGNGATLSSCSTSSEPPLRLEVSFLDGEVARGGADIGAETAVEQDVSARIEFRAAVAGVGACERQRVAAAGPKDPDIIVEGGGSRVGQAHVDLV